MNLILSRKGFDDKNGKLANLILPDGKFLVFPIADKVSPIMYKDIKVNIGSYNNLYNLLVELGDINIKENHNAHLDPDLVYDNLARNEYWRPVFGQEESSQTHLKNNNISKGDIFLFFGSFKRTEWLNDKLVYSESSLTVHIIYGYFCVENIIDLTKELPCEYNWIKYHPHLKHNSSPNVIYVSSKKLKIENKEYNLKGAGVFKSFNDKLILTKPYCYKSYWKLPLWFYPYINKRKPLTYHDKMERWKLYNDHVELHSTAPGQEFILNTMEYPESINWINNIILD